MSITGEDIELLSTLSIEENRAQVKWFRHLTFVLSTLLGVLVSLGNKTDDNRQCHYCFGLATLLLSLALLGFLALLYIYSVRSARQAKETYRNELNNAIRKETPIRPIGVSLPKGTQTLQIASFACAGVSFVLLGVYSLLS